MRSQARLDIALAKLERVPADWMPAAQVQPFTFQDPAVVWLEYHGAQHGLGPDASPYEFADFIAEKARQFEDKWPMKRRPVWCAGVARWRTGIRRASCERSAC